MSLIWKGLGILVAVIWVVSILVGNWLAKTLFGPDPSRGTYNLTVEWLAAALTLVLALLLRIQKPAGDPWDNPEPVRPTHSLFFIPVIAWSAIFFVLGIVLYLHYS